MKKTFKDRLVPVLGYLFLFLCAGLVSFIGWILTVFIFSLGGDYVSPR